MQTNELYSIMPSQIMLVLYELNGTVSVTITLIQLWLLSTAVAYAQLLGTVA